MANLTDTQRLILNHAAARRSGAVLPLPDTLKLKGGALKATLATLTKRGLIEERQIRKKPSFQITASGRAAIRRHEPKGKARSRKSPPPSRGISDIDRPKTKRDRIVALLERPEGASIDDLTVATGWQAHSVRAALTGLRKRGHSVARGKHHSGATVYRIAAR